MAGDFPCLPLSSSLIMKGPVFSLTGGEQRVFYFVPNDDIDIKLGVLAN